MNKIWKLILWVGISLSMFGGLCGLYFGAKHYYLWENSEQWFHWNHTFFPYLEMYTDQWSYHPGDTIWVYASGHKEAEGKILMYDIMQRDSVGEPQKIQVFPQVSPKYASQTGAEWKVSLKLPIPQDLRTTWYVLEFGSGDQNAFTSVFISPKPGNIMKDVAWILSTNTWNAYNYWGGQSLYTKNVSPVVSFHRPQLLANPFIKNTYANHQLWYQAANKDRYLAELMAQNGINYDPYSMDKLHKDAEQFSPYKLLVFSTHSEYWTIEMMDHLRDYLDQGGSVMCLSGNTSAFISQLNLQTDQLVVHKSEASLWNVGDTQALKVFGLSNNLASFHSYAPYEVETDTSWVLAGTGLGKGDLFGAQSDTYDYTFMYGNWLSQLKALRNKGKMGAASGLEVDVVSANYLEKWIRVAKGKNFILHGYGEVYPESPKNASLSWNGGGGADLGYYLHEGGGIVFNAGSLAFTGAIPYDTTIRKIILNVIEKTVHP